MASEHLMWFRRRHSDFCINELHKALWSFIWMTLVERHLCVLGIVVLRVNYLSVLVAWHRWRWFCGLYGEVSGSALPSRSFGRIENTCAHLKQLLSRIFYGTISFPDLPKAESFWRGDFSGHLLGCPFKHKMALMESGVILSSNTVAPWGPMKCAHHTICFLHHNCLDLLCLNFMVLLSLHCNWFANVPFNLLILSLMGLRTKESILLGLDIKMSNKLTLHKSMVSFF